MEDDEIEIAYEPTSATAQIGEWMTLADCPVGLFLTDAGMLCLKTEYGNEGRIDAYIVDSGEMFWGAPPQTIASQRASRVRPVIVDLPSPQSSPQFPWMECDTPKSRWRTVLIAGGARLHLV